MSIHVVFGKNGFYHPAFGRMGRGDANRGLVYTLPDAFKEKGMLPSSAEIVDAEDLDEVLEEIEQLKAIKPKVVDETKLPKAATGAGQRNPAPSAQERTAPSKPKRAPRKAKD